MTSRVIVRLAVTVALSCSSAMPQVALHPIRTILIAGEAGGPIVNPLRCDDKGNVYFRRYEHLSENTPIRSITPDGSFRAMFSFEKAKSELPNLNSDEFAVSSDGLVYAVGWNGQDPYLFSFDKKGGEYRSKMSLNKDLVVHQLGVFPKGEFLLAGLQAGSSDNPLGNRPMTEIVDEDGKFLRKVSFPHDEKFRSLAESGDSLLSRGGIGNLAVSLGTAVSAADGQVYLMRHSTPAVIYVVSAGGEIRNTLSVTSPDGGVPMAMQVHARDVVIQFWNESTKRAVYKVVGLPDGDEIATYEGVEGMGTGFACYDGSQFTFLMPKAGKMYIVHAEPK